MRSFQVAHVYCVLIRAWCVHALSLFSIVDIPKHSELLLGRGLSRAAAAAHHTTRHFLLSYFLPVSNA